MRFICAQPATTYYSWQVEVMINNFMELGINPNHIDIVCWKPNGEIPDDWSKLANRYNTVRFFFYDDTRETKHYISSIRPNVLRQHWEARPEIWKDTIFYHDCDIVFTKLPDFKQFENDDKWYGSDCRWYIGHDYILSKGQDVLDAMCDITGMNADIIKANELNSIGAQYILKGVDANYWRDVEADSERLFKDITELNNKKKKLDPTHHELQIWCADMWAVLWNGWKRGKETVCHNDLTFAWATSAEKEWHEFYIFHNAGVTSNKDGYFYKADYINKLPYNETIQVKKDSASYHYWELIQKTAKISCLI